MQIRRPSAAPVAHAFDVLSIVVVSLLVATSLVAYTLWTKTRTAEMQWNRATQTVGERVGFRGGDEDVVSLYETQTGLEAQLRDLSRVLGYYRGEEATSNLASAQALVADVAAEFGGEVTTVAQAVAVLESRLDAVVNGAGGTRALEATRDGLQGGADLGAIGGARGADAARVRALESQLAEALTAVAAARSANAQARSGLRVQRDAAQAGVRRARQQKRRVQQSLHAVKRQYDDERERLKETLAHAEDGARDLEHHIRVLTKTLPDRDPRRPDGKVLRSDSRRQVAWIDLGRRQRVMRGMRFEVFRYRKGGKVARRGLVQVIKVGADSSQVRILERQVGGRVWTMTEMAKAPRRVWLELQVDPLVLGDHIRNPLFDRRQVRTFVFAGRLTGPPKARARYGAAEAKRLIEELGDRVDPRVTARTSYVVLGEGYRDDPAFRQAEELGIPKLSEKELLEILGKY